MPLGKELNTSQNLQTNNSKTTYAPFVAETLVPVATNLFPIQPKMVPDDSNLILH